jgi:hypothetical protein
MNSLAATDALGAKSTFIHRYIFTYILNTVAFYANKHNFSRYHYPAFYLNYYILRNYSLENQLKN